MPRPGRVLAIMAASALMGFLAAQAAPKAALPGARRAARNRSAPRIRVLIVGGGFGGLAAASRLAGRPGIDLTLIDMQNHHLFQPLLYQVATAALSPADIASPLRGILPASPGVHVLMDQVTGLDTAGRQVLCRGRSVPYDELIIASGSRPSYFGHEDWAGIAPSLKTLDDALGLRRQVLEVFERASRASPAEQDRLLTFVLIGGGPTGVEMAGSIAELARDMLTRDFALPRARARIVLVEAGPTLLSGFGPESSEYAVVALHALGVEIMTDTKVTAIEPGTVRLADQLIAAATIIWTAGTEATPVAAWLGVKPGHGGRVAVGGDLRVPGFPEIAVIGDAALSLDPHGKPLPGLAPVAKQQGEFVARTILRRMRGRQAPARFGYRNYGTLATIGRNKAVAEFGPVHVSGFAAWVTWAVAHVFFLIGFRSRVMVSAQWLFAYVTNQRAGRLIIRRNAVP